MYRVTFLHCVKQQFIINLYKLTTQSKVLSQICWHSSALDLGKYTPFLPSMSHLKNFPKFHSYAKYVFVSGSAYINSQTKTVFLI